jgi:hypothetical protein
MFTRLRDRLFGPPGIHWQRAAILLWVVVLAGSCVRCLVGHSDRNVGMFAVYAEAGRHWLNGAELYPPKDAWESFLYSPAVAAGLVPYSLPPLALGNVLWRLTVGGAYLLALWWWSRTVLPSPLTRKQRALVFLLVVPVTAMTILDGQAGGLVAAAVLLAVAAAAEERWGYAAAFATLACLLKVYPIALLLLLVVAYPRRAAWPAAAAVVAGLALPFLFQRPAYVADQYGKWIGMMAASDRQDWNLDIANRDVAILFRAWGAPLDQRVWLIARVGAAAGAAALCLAARRAGWPRRTLLFTLQGLATCWMTLFGPVVESFTYILIGPGLAWMLVDAWNERRSWTYRALLSASWAIFTSATLAVPFMHSIVYHRLGPHPLAGLLLLTGLLVDAGRRFAERPGVSSRQADARRAA